MNNDYDFKTKDDFSQSCVRKLKATLTQIEAKEKTKPPPAESPPPQVMWHKVDGRHQMLELLRAPDDSEVSARVVPSDVVDQHRTAIILKTLLNGLRRKSEEHNKMCQEALVAIGPQIRHKLLLEVFTAKGHPQYKVRLLEVIARLGPIDDPDDILMLVDLELHKNQSVREMATAVKRRTVSGLAASP